MKIGIVLLLLNFRSTLRFHSYIQPTNRSLDLLLGVGTLDGDRNHLKSLIVKGITSSFPLPPRKISKFQYRYAQYK